MSDKTKAEWLREFADAMEADPCGWWRQYEYETGLGVRGGFVDGLHALGVLMGGAVIHRRARTVTRYDKNGERVELPEPMRAHPHYRAQYCALSWNGGFSASHPIHWAGNEWDHFQFESGNCFATQADAQAWADYFRSLLETRDD